MATARRSQPTSTNGLSGLVVLDDDETSEIGAVRSRIRELDPIAAESLDALARKFAGAGKKAERLVASRGLTDEIHRVTDRLNRGGLSDMARVLLSNHDVYASALLEALEKEKVKGSDISGIVGSVRRTLEEKAYRGTFEALIVASVFRRNHISLPSDEEGPAYERHLRLLRRLRTETLDLAPGRPEAQVLRLAQEVAADGALPDVIAGWATREGIPTARLTAPVVERMTKQLQRYGISFTIDSGADDRYDEYLAIAYDDATRLDGDTSDPIALTRASLQTVTPWDFRVDHFETAEEQGVLIENVLAAGALDYVWWLGEVLGVFKLTDTLVLRWAAGMVDISDSITASKLYRYWQLRDDRISPEERGMLYKRVLSRGETEVLSRMTVNEGFQPLWHKLMEKVAEHIELTSDAARETAISRVPIERATKELQFNLTEHMTGMAHMQVTDMYMQLREAFELLGSDEVTGQLSMGRRRGVWATIDKLHREELGSAPDIASVRALAVEGNRVFQWIADFDPSLGDGRFEEFRDAAEAWIIAASTVGEAMPAAGGEPEEEEEEDDFGGFDAEEGEEEEW